MFNIIKMHGTIVALLTVIILILVFCNYDKLSTITNPFGGSSEHMSLHNLSKSASTFSNTLQRRLGMGGAGESYTTKPLAGTFDSHGGLYEKFKNSVAANTMWDGYYKSSVLPI